MSIEKSLILIQSKKKKKIQQGNQNLPSNQSHEKQILNLRSEVKKKNNKERWIKASKSDCLNTMDYYLDLTFVLHKDDVALSIFNA